MNFQKLSSILLLLMVGFSMSAQQSLKLPKGMVENASVEGITEYELENGLKVLLFPDQSKATITVNITYLVGSRHEGYGETGMAHLLEHLVFKGTPDHPNIPQELTEHGARPNGTTWYDRTNYFETFNASEENLKWALHMEADRMINSYIAKKDLDSEMTVVRNEFEMGENSPGSVLMDKVMGSSFAWHNYGKSTIGARSDIENVPIGRLKDFYQKYYQPDNSVLLVAGKFDEQKTLDLIHEYYAGIPRPERKLYPTYTKEPTQDGERLVTLKRVGDVQVVSCAYHTPPGSHSDYAAISVITELLTDQPSGRLYKALVETKKASSQWGFAPALKEGGFIYLNADVRKENSLNEVKEIMLATLDDLSENPPTQEEVDRAKSNILKNWDLAFNNSSRIGMRMSEYIAQGDWRLLFLYRDRVEAITTEDVVRVANKYFVPSNRTVGMFLPTENPLRADIPDAPDVASLVSSYKGKEVITAGEVFEATPDNIDSRTVSGKFANGMEYALLTKETRGNAVVANIQLRFGTPKDLVGKQNIANFTGSMLNKGTEEMTRQEIQDKIDALKARISVSGGNSSAFVRLETTKENLPAVLDLVAEILKEPSFPENEFEKLKEQSLSSLEEQLSDPQALATNALSRIMSDYPKDDVRYVPTLQEEIEMIKAVTYDEVVGFYNDYYGASEGTVSIVGDFEESEVLPKLENNFGGWENPGEYKRISTPYKKAAVEMKVIKTPDKSNSVFFAGLNMPVGDEHPDHAALTIGNYILGGGFLNSRLATRIRQQDGLSYGVGSFLYGNSMDESGGFGAYAICAPENSEKVYQAFKEEIERVRKDGFTQEELDAARKGWLQSQEVSRSQDNSLTGMLNSNLRLDRDFQWSESFENKIKNLSLQEVNNAMIKHIDAEKMFYVRAGDFDKVDKTIKP
jgi:zinc protease